MVDINDDVGSRRFELLELDYDRSTTKPTTTSAIPAVDTVVQPSANGDSTIFVFLYRGDREFLAVPSQRYSLSPRYFVRTQDEISRLRRQISFLIRDLQAWTVSISPVNVVRFGRDQFGETVILSPGVGIQTPIDDDEYWTMKQQIAQLQNAVEELRAECDTLRRERDRYRAECWTL